MPTYKNVAKTSQGKYGQTIEPKDDVKELYVYLNTDGTNLIMLDEKPYQNNIIQDFQITPNDFVDGTYTLEIPLDIYDEYGIKINPFFLVSNSSHQLSAYDLIKLYFNSIENTPGMSFYERVLIDKLAGKFAKFIFVLTDKTLSNGNIDFKIHIQIGKNMFIS